MKKKIICTILACSIIFVNSSSVSATVMSSKPAQGTHTTHGNEEKGGSSSNKGNKSSGTESKKDTSNPSKKDNTSNKSKGNSSSGTGSGMTTQDRINVSTETSRGETQTSTTSSSKTMVDSYNWYFENDGVLVPGIADDWIRRIFFALCTRTLVSFV